MQWRNYVIVTLLIPAAYGVFAWNRGPEVKIEEKEVVKVVEKIVEVAKTQQKSENTATEFIRKRPDGTITIKRQVKGVEATDKVQEKTTDTAVNAEKKVTKEVRIEKQYASWLVAAEVASPLTLDAKKTDLRFRAGVRVLGNNTFLTFGADTDLKLLELRKLGVGVLFTW